MAGVTTLETLVIYPLAILGFLTVGSMLVMAFLMWRSGRGPERAARQLGGWR